MEPMYQARLDDYLNFMNWFKNKFPELYSDYSHRINVATDDAGVTVELDEASGIIGHKLISITQDYYKRENK